LPFYAGQEATDESSLVKVLQELRLQQALTQDQLAERAGTERSHISAMERAEKGPTLATILNLAAALNLPVGHLMGLVEERLKNS
jgi:transcriptional regulator with XRE-family HTH domain